MADNGERVVIRRGDKAYVVTPISEEGDYFTPEMLDKIDHSLQEAKEGKVHHFDSMEELDKFVDVYGV